MTDFLASFQARDAFRGQVAENSSRLAFAFGTFTTTGWGEVRIEECLSFGLSFVNKPFIGSSWDIDDAVLVPGRFPMISSGVVRWRRNSKGFYTGAWVAMKVETKSPYISTSAAEPNYSIDHSFIFAGLASKDLPDHLANQAL
jgi:hypothetical protein